MVKTGFPVKPGMTVFKISKTLALANEDSFYASAETKMAQILDLRHFLAAAETAFR